MRIRITITARRGLITIRRRKAHRWDIIWPWSLLLSCFWLQCFYLRTFFQCSWNPDFPCNFRIFAWFGLLFCLGLNPMSWTCFFLFLLLSIIRAIPFLLGSRFCFVRFVLLLCCCLFSVLSLLMMSCSFFVLSFIVVVVVICIVVLCCHHCCFACFYNCSCSTCFIIFFLLLVAFLFLLVWSWLWFMFLFLVVCVCFRPSSFVVIFWGFARAAFLWHSTDPKKWECEKREREW